MVNSVEVWEDLLRRRQETSKGFTEIEEKNGGFVRTIAPLSTMRGQEILRIILFRVLEELTESFLADDEKHQHEECVDAFNYLLMATMLDIATGLGITGISQLAVLLYEAAEEAEWRDEEIGPLDLGMFVAFLAGDLTDTLRNRTWMLNAQDFYFSGQEVFRTAVKNTALKIFETFPSFDNFWRFFVSKDDVLRFRLRSHY